MKRLLKNKDGVALIMIIIVTTFVMIITTSLLNLSFRNYLLIKTHGNKNASYYIADFGAEKVVKNIETVVESAKIYANEMVRTDVITGSSSIKLRDPAFPSEITKNITGITPYEYFIKYSTSGGASDVANQDFVEAFEQYYSNYIEDVNSSISKGGIYSVQATSPVQIPNTSALAGAEYTAQITAYNNYVCDIKVVGKIKDGSQEKYVRELKIQVGINPWGYSQTNGTPIASNAVDIEVSKDEIYASPQWTSALASSGDIIVKGGKVIVDGDIFVNGNTPEPSGTDNLDGSKYGGLVVGKNNQEGKLEVHGNIFSSGYVHTSFPKSEISVKKRDSVPSDAAYDSKVDQLYNNTTNAKYSEKADELNKNNGNPLNTEISDKTLSKLGSKQVHQAYIDYIKNTYRIQKEAGGFVYANSIQVDKQLDDLVAGNTQTITTAGSVIVYDNLQIDSVGSINVGKNYYGFKTGSGIDANKYDKSSSIITNNANGVITIGKRVYAGGVAYVTAFSETDNKPYITGEAISLYKNFYSYRIALSGESFPIKLYMPFKFLDIPNTEDKLNHVLGYDNSNPSGPTISNGGNAYDKDMVKLTGILEGTESTTRDPIYNSNTSKGDMGYSEGILMGKNSNDQNFIGNVKNEAPNPAVKSLRRDAFINYVAEKYATLMEVKALKGVDREVVTINELTSNNGNSYISGKVLRAYNDAEVSNFIAVDGNIKVTCDGSKIVINRYDITDTTLTSPTKEIETTGTTFNGLIFATGKILIDSDYALTINGAIVSAKYVQQPTPLNTLNTEGIIFLGDGLKNIKYDKSVMLGIFKLPNSDAQTIKKLLTSERGTVEMFKKVYDNNSVNGFQSAVNAFFDANKYSATNPTGKYNIVDEAIVDIANMYEIVGDSSISDKVVLQASVISNGSSSISNKNYRILSWKTIK